MHTKYKKMKATSKYHRIVITCIIGFSILYWKSYQTTQTEIKEDINTSFRDLAPYWADTIINRKNVYRLYEYDSKGYHQKRTKRIVWENGDVKISPNIFHPKTLDEYFTIMNSTHFIVSKEYDLPLIDSLFNEIQHKAGHQVTATITLDAKNLSEMFPIPDSLATNTSVEHSESRPHPGKPDWETDPISIGICGHGTLVARITLPTSYILSAMPWWTFEHTILLIACIACLCFFIGLELKKLFYQSNKQWIGCSILDKETGILISLQNGNNCKLSDYKLQLLNSLLEAPDNQLTKKEVCEMFWKNRNVKECTSNYNTMISRLRTDLSLDPTIVLLSKPEEKIQLTYIHSSYRILQLIRHLFKRRR